MLKIVGIIQAIVFPVSAILWWILGVHSVDRLGTILMAMGVALAGIGVFSAHGSTYGPLHHNYRMGRTVGSSTATENYDREIKDKNKSYSTLATLFVAGIIPIAAGVLLTMIKK